MSYKINIMINGLPGQVTTAIASQAAADSRVELIPFSLTGPEIEVTETIIGAVPVKLIKPEVRDDLIADIKKEYSRLIMIDFTHPSAVNDNCEFYCRHQLPFVMGTTGGDRQSLLETVKNSDICAVIAPNMAKQIVGFQAMLDFAAREFPGMFAGYSLTIKESHQAGKADTSGTARAMVSYFNDLGLDFNEEQISQERDPQVQEKEWSVPPEHLTGHGWHTYTLISPDKSTKFEFTHNINGRDIYAQGTFDAVCYLNEKLVQGARGAVFSMIDVLKG